MCAARVRPPWLKPLNEAVERDEWLRVLHAVDEVALRVFLERHGLQYSDLSFERVDHIRDALADARITLDDLIVWRADLEKPMGPIERINEFRRKDDVIAAHDSTLSGDLDEAVLEILRRIWKGTLDVDSWTDFIDKQKELAPRHLFLYHVPPLTNVEERLVPARHVANPAKPELAEVSIEGGLLRMRWVAMRGEKRRVAFVRIDLASGAMELQIELMDGGGVRALAAERNAYARAVAESLGVTPEPLHLETPMRALMSDPRLRLEAWRVRRPNGGEASGKREADLFERLRGALDHYYALDLKGKWQAPDGRLLAVQLDTRTDAITIREQCAASEVEALTVTIREHPAPPPPPPPPEPPPVTVTETADDIPPVPPPPPRTADELAQIAELRALIEKFIAYQQRLGKEKVSAESLPSKAQADLLFDYETLEKALRTVGVRFLGATLYVMCPGNGEPVRQNGQVMRFESLEAIPEKIECHNEEGPPKEHFTKGNVWIEIIAPKEPAPPPPVIVPGPLPPPPPVGNDDPPGPGPGTVLIWFIVYMFANTSFHYWLLVKNAAIWFVGVSFAIAVIGPVVLIRWKFGHDAFKDGTQVITQSFKNRFGPKDEEESP